MIGALLGLGVLVNYFDRVNVSVSQEALHHAFGISNTTFGLLSSAYNWTYAALQLPSGVLLDHFGVPLIGRISTLLWSLATFGTALAIGIWTFFGTRLLLGIGEAPTFPASAKAVGYWFPRAERSLATAMFDGMAKFAPAIGVPAIGLLLVHAGWRWSFAATGFLSLIYFALFYWFYRDPAGDRGLSDAERRLIAEGGGQSGAPDAKERRSGAMFLYMVRQRKAIGLTIGFAAYNYVFYLLLTWLPSYFSQALHLQLSRSVIYSSIPWLCATAAEFLLGGWMVNALIQRGFDASRVRQIFLVGGTTFGLGILGAARARTLGEAILWISISISGLSVASPVGWSVPSLIAPEEGVGTLGGILNFGNQCSAIVAPIVTGCIRDWTHSFAWAFRIAAIFLLIGIASYIALLGRIEPIPAPPSGGRAAERGAAPRAG